MHSLRTTLTYLCLAALLFSPVSLAQLYKWTDDQGSVHYGDSPPENVELKKVGGQVSSYTSVSVEELKNRAAAVSNSSSNSNANRSGNRKNDLTVIMYSTSWCGYCKRAAKHFRQNKIPFKEYDIEKSAKAAREYKKLNGRGVPVILIGNRRMNGFDPKAFDRIYFDS